MSKTPEEMAHYYADRLHERIAHTGVFVEGFVAGYQAAKESNSLEKPDGSNSSNNSNGWISVKDRLPEFCEDVLVRGECGIIDQGLRIKRSHSDEWVWSALNYSGCAEEVTHWMPLPKSPDE